MFHSGFAEATAGYVELAYPASETALLACLAHLYEVAPDVQKQNVKKKGARSKTPGMPLVRRGQQILVDGAAMVPEKVVKAELLDVLVTADYLQIESMVATCRKRFQKSWYDVATSPQLRYPAIPSPLFEKLCLWMPSTYIEDDSDSDSDSDEETEIFNNYFILDTVFRWGEKADPAVVAEIIAKIQSAHFKNHPLSIHDIKALAETHGQKFREALSVDLLLQIM
ncbi:hypothetical protein DFJ73DRAFT_807195 [Zopfochytrium polystomum]|nr:hypothetical protein DFJ73DRAFT_807195 [Zopfochytrium polystomum]